MQDENTKRSGARLTSLLTVFAVLVCMLSLMILPASAASEPTADSFYGKWTVTEKAISGAAIPSEDFNFDGNFLIDGQLYHEIWFDIMVLPASAAAEPTTDQFYGKLTIKQTY